MTGTFDEPGLFPPKGEFFCKDRESWMPEVPSTCSASCFIGLLAEAVIDVFHKVEIKE